MSDESSTGRSDPASQASGPDPDTAVDEPDLEDAASAGEEPADNNNDDVEESPRDEDEEDDDGNLVDGEGGAEEHDAQSSAGSPRPDSAAQANEPSSEPAIAAAGLAPQTVGEPSPSAATAAPVSSIGNMTEQEVYAMALNEFKTKGEPEAGPAPPRRRLQVPRLDELCIAKIAANLSEWPLLDQVPQQYVSSIVRRVAPATIQLSRAAQQISSEVFWKHMSARWPLAEVAHHGSSYKRLFFENFLQERLEQYHASKAASTLQDVMADVEAARPFVHTVRLGQQRAHINLAHVFKGFFNLTTLDLVYGAPDVGMNFDPDLFGMKSKDASALSTMLLETRSLSNFYVRQSQVDDELLGLLMRGLTGNQTVTCLDLSHNRISNDGAVKLAEMLTHDCVLISLNLADNCISGEGGAALGHALSKNATLQELSLRLNDVGDQGGAALLRGLIDNNTLESLNLSCNGLGAHSQAALVDLIHHGNALTSIDVSGNDCVPEDDAGARLLQEVRDNAMISYLDLRENKSLSAAVDAEISALLYAREERIERTRRQNYFAERMPAH